MRTTIFCKHYRAMHDNKTCEVGVSYEQFKGTPFDNHPCFRKCGHVAPGCDKQEFPTDEEIAAEDAEFEALFARTAKARAAIVEHLGGPWKRGMDGLAGAIDCPICNAAESLRFTRSGCNGHIHAACETDDCVRWIE